MALSINSHLVQAALLCGMGRVSVDSNIGAVDFQMAVGISYGNSRIDGVLSSRDFALNSRNNGSVVSSSPPMPATTP